MIVSLSLALRDRNNSEPLWSVTSVLGDRCQQHTYDRMAIDIFRFVTKLEDDRTTAIHALEGNNSASDVTQRNCISICTIVIHRIYTNRDITSICPVECSYSMSIWC
jgi:hypothetical protein